MKPPEVRFPGRIPFEDALRLQEETVAELRGARTRGEPRAGVLYLLEHEPVYTIGRTRDQSSLGAATGLPHPAHEINRGGRATYHGPGQLVGYPVLDLSGFLPDLHAYLRFLENFLIALLGEFGVAGERREEFTGAWVDGKKIASIGVGVRHWISMHGFALNVEPQCLDGFSAITPCGIANVRMTCLSMEAGRALPMREVTDRAAALFPAFFIAEAGRRNQASGAES